MSLLVLELVVTLLMAFLAGIAVVVAIAPEATGAGRLSRALSAVTTLAALGFLYVCVTTAAPRIATTLDHDVSQRLEVGSLPAVVVDADGRDVVLRGTVGTDEERLRAGVLATTTPGVRHVENRITVGGPPPTPSPDALPPSVASAITAAPATAAVTRDEVQRRLDRILLNTKIEFATGSDVILASSAPVLEELLAVLNQAPHLNVRIEGHTDNLGDPGTNRALSAARATAVLTWLVGRGVPVSRLTAEGFGADRPVASNDTAAGRARNRRVEVIAQ